MEQENPLAWAKIRSDPPAAQAQPPLRHLSATIPEVGHKKGRILDHPKNHAFRGQTAAACSAGFVLVSWEGSNLILAFP